MKERLIRALKKMRLGIFSIVPIHISSKTFGKKIFLLYTPTRSTNMGDQAIRKGQICFLKSFFPKYKIIECDKYIWCEKHETAIRMLKKAIKKQDLIMIQGGGYIGDLWTGCEEDLRSIIASFPKNKIVALPNTAYYSDTPLGKRFLEEDREFYKKHTNALIFLRDRRSYGLMCDIAGAERCFYKPDMALMLKPDYKVERQDILICARHDHEKVQSSETFERIKQTLEKKGYSVKYTDTVKEVRKNFKYSQRIRDKYFEETLKEFAGAKLIITDRLHGMVLSAVTKTPCIATDNISKKVSGVHEWIKHLDYIRVAASEDIGINVIEELLQTKPVYDNSGIMNEFEKMAEEIRVYWEK